MYEYFTKTNHCRRILCKFKFPAVITMWLLTFLLLSSAVTASSNKKEKGAQQVYEGQIPLADSKKISILIGDDKENAIRSNAGGSGREFGIFEEDGDGGGSGNSTGGGAAAVSTTWDKCGEGSKCCYQYTWPGYFEDIPAPANATCEYLQKHLYKDNNFACFDPLVFTQPTSQVARWTPPDFDELVNRARANNWNIYCPMADQNCITYTYYSRDDNKLVSNQTKFCGIVTDANTGSRIRDGCYRQNMPGYIREVCVSNRNLGNRGGASSDLRLTRSNAILAFTLAFLTYLFSIKSNII